MKWLSFESVGIANSKATGWKDCEFVWHCTFHGAKWLYSRRSRWFSGHISTVTCLAKEWARAVHECHFEDRIFFRNKNEKWDEETEKRRHNLSFVWLVHVDEFLVCLIRISCCSVRLIYCAEWHKVTLRYEKCFIIGVCIRLNTLRTAQTHLHTHTCTSLIENTEQQIIIGKRNRKNNNEPSF